MVGREANGIISFSSRSPRDAGAIKAPATISLRASSITYQARVGISTVKAAQPRRNQLFSCHAKRVHAEHPATRPLLPSFPRPRRPSREHHRRDRVVEARACCSWRNAAHCSVQQANAKTCFERAQLSGSAPRARARGVICGVSRALLLHDRPNARNSAKSDPRIMYQISK